MVAPAAIRARATGRPRIASPVVMPALIVRSPQITTPYRAAWGRTGACDRELTVRRSRPCPGERNGSCRRATARSNRSAGHPSGVTRKVRRRAVGIWSARPLPATVAGRDPLDVGPHGGDGARALHAGDERQPHRVRPAAIVGADAVDACRGDLDQQLPGAGLGVGQLGVPQDVRATGFGALDGAPTGSLGGSWRRVRAQCAAGQREGEAAGTGEGVVELPQAEPARRHPVGA